MAHNDDTKLLGITDNDQIICESSQRRCGPPKHWTSSPPAKGCEVFVAKIPKDIFEKDVIYILKQVGEIYMFRLMMEDKFNHRGFGFCTFVLPDSAKEAVAKLNNFQIKKNWPLGVCFSVDNCRLFVGGIPKLKVKSEIFEEMNKVTENVVDIIMYPSAADKNKNRGFAFVEYTDHKSAAMARKKMIINGIQLWGHNVAVDWAEPERTVDEETMSKVKILYVRNLMLTTTEDTINQTFSKYTNENDEIVRVKKIGDFAFVHFKNRKQAEIARENLNGYDLEGSIIEVNFAKPANKLEQQQKLLKKSTMTINKAIPLTLTKEFKKLSIDQINNEDHPLMGLDNKEMSKSYRNAAGRCSVKSKQIIKNQDQNSEDHLINYTELLTYTCQVYGWDVPYFTTQMIPMFIPDAESSIPVFLAQVYIPVFNYNFPCMVSSFSCEEAISSASETALQWMFYNGIQIPLLCGQGNSYEYYSGEKDQNTLKEKAYQSNLTSFQKSSVSSMSSNKNGANNDNSQRLQYSSLIPCCTRYFIQPNHYYSQMSEYKEPEKVKVTLTNESKR